MASEKFPAAQKPWRIVVADDHPLFRSAIRHTLERHAGHLEVVGEAADGREAVELCRRSRPALVLMDLRMPGMDGIAATRAIEGELPDTLVLVLTALRTRPASRTPWRRAPPGTCSRTPPPPG